MAKYVKESCRVEVYFNHQASYCVDDSQHDLKSPFLAPYFCGPLLIISIKMNEQKWQLTLNCRVLFSYF